MIVGVLARWFETRSPENPRTNLAQAAFWLLDALGGTPSAAGTRVNPRTALSAPAIQAAVRVIAETVGTLPLLVYERLERGKRRAIEHPLYPILREQPNPEMTACVWLETQMAHLLLWGNAYSEIQRNGRGEVVALWPLLPDRTRLVRRGDGEGFYETSVPDGTTVRLRREDVLHVPGLTFDGRTGLAAILLARESVGLTLAAEEYGARFFSNAAQPSGVLEHPGQLSEEAVRRLREAWQATYGGLTNAHRVAILEEGMKWQQIGADNRNAQFVDTRKFQATESARLFRVPPHLIGDLERATFSNIEHQQIEFVVYTLRPYLVRWEQAINTRLFSQAARGRFFAEFLIEGLLRGDTQSRYAAYAVGRQWGWLSADDVRELENMNPLPDEQGGIYLVPANMLSAGALSDPPRDQTARRIRSIVAGVARRLARREADRVAALAQRHAASPERWREELTAFYREFAERLSEALELALPVARRYCAERAREAERGLPGPDWIERGERRLVALALAESMEEDDAVA